MCRLRNDLPYTFRPSVDQSWIRPAGMWVNRHIHLGRKYRITRIEENGMDDASLCVSAQREQLLDDLDRVFTALQAHSYIGDYITVDPTTDRRAEMIMKLEEDLLGFPFYPVSRTVTVTAGAPIPVSNLLASGEIPPKGGALALTARLESDLSQLLSC